MKTILIVFSILIYNNLYSQGIKEKKEICKYDTVKVLLVYCDTSKTSLVFCNQGYEIIEIIKFYDRFVETKQGWEPYIKETHVKFLDRIKNELSKNIIVLNHQPLK